AMGLANARVLCERAETVGDRSGREAYDVVTVRAVGRLATLAELAAPLLERPGTLVAWKGRRDPAEESELARAAEELGMRVGPVLPVGPYAGSANRHLHVVTKIAATPRRFPRRPGVAKKRPLGVV
ncbi:MAG: RsmG family class I SAM-dependent methyltransferase, partial [Solirubrobacterales bacterium]